MKRSKLYLSGQPHSISDLTTRFHSTVEKLSVRRLRASAAGEAERYTA
jgi:hypothetical protein